MIISSKFMQQQRNKLKLKLKSILFCRTSSKLQKLYLFRGINHIQAAVNVVVLKLAVNDSSNYFLAFRRSTSSSRATFHFCNIRHFSSDLQTGKQTLKTLKLTSSICWAPVEHEDNEARQSSYLTFINLLVTC